MEKPEQYDKESTALFLSEYVFDLDEGSSFLKALSDSSSNKLREIAESITMTKGSTLFQQGQAHRGVWIIESGRVRSFYSGPTGREITLAYWGEGHFVGGPEVFGRGRHLWSANTVLDSELLYIPGEVLNELVREYPDFAVAVIEGLIAKGKCYSALIQMLGTRSVSERLQQLLLILVDTHGHIDAGGEIIVKRTITFDQIATIVGASRQWVTRSLETLQTKGVLQVNRKEIRILVPSLLSV